MKSVGPVISPVDASAGPATVTLCSGVSRRANASAVAMSHWSALARIASARRRRAWTGIFTSLPPERSVAEPVGSSCSRSRVESSSSIQRVGRSRTVTPCSPSGGTTWLPGGSSNPSVTSRMCGVASRSSAPKRGRSLRSGGSKAARSARDVVTIRIGPTASVASRLRACGNHLIQSQWAMCSSAESTATMRCSGEWKAVAEQMIERARARACSSSPQSSTRSKARRSTDAGRLGWVRCTTSRRWSAEAEAGSTSSSGALSGGTSSTARGWAHSP